MATVIDELVLELGLDPSKFTRGQKEAVESARKTGEELERHGKRIEKTTKDTSGYFSELRGNLIALYAAFTAGKGLKEFVVDTVEATAGVGRFSKQLDISSGELSQWNSAGERMGGTAAEMQGSIFSLSQALQQFTLTGQSAVIPFLRALDINLYDNAGKVKSATQLYIEAADRVQGMGGARGTALLQGLGASQSMVQFLMQGGAKVRQQLGAQRGTAITNEQTEAAEKLEGAWADLGSTSTATGRQIQTELTPTLMSFFGVIQHIMDYLQTHPNAAKAVFGTLTALVGLLSVGLVTSFAKVAVGAAAGGFAVLVRGAAGLIFQLGVLTASVLPALGDAFVAVSAAIEATPVGWILTGIAALAGAAFLVYRNWGSIKGWWSNLWGGMAGESESAADRIRAAEDRALGIKAPAAASGGRTGAAGGPPIMTNRGERIGDQTVPNLQLRNGQTVLGALTGGGSLQDLIGRGEGGYNSVRSHGRAGTADLANMTLDEIMARQRAGNLNAVGRYQAVPATLAMAAKGMGLSGREKFDARMQDRLFNWLITVKRPQIGAYLSGKSNNLYAAQLAAAEEWASVADPDTGMSHYWRQGNRASISSNEMANALNSYRNARGAGRPVSASRIHAGHSYTRTSSTQIGSMTIVTQARDSREIAQSFHSALRDSAYGNNANYGMA